MTKKRKGSGDMLPMEVSMPIKKVKGGYKYGKAGKVYKKRGDAAKQGHAVAASKSRQNRSNTKKR